MQRQKLIRQIFSILKKLDALDLNLILQQATELYQNQYDTVYGDKPAAASMSHAKMNHIFNESLKRLQQERQEIKQARLDNLGKEISVYRLKPGDPGYPWKGTVDYDEQNSGRDA